jgi:BASS family bile acid:Na+ symporter
MLVIFAVAVMDGVTAAFWARPEAVLRLLLAACGAGVFWHLVGFALFKRQGLPVAYTAALLNGNRNMGLMLAVTLGTAGEAFALYVGIAQIPMYFAPLLLGPFVRHSFQDRSHS